MKNYWLPTCGMKVRLSWMMAWNHARTKVAWLLTTVPLSDLRTLPEDQAARVRCMFLFTPGGDSNVTLSEDSAKIAENFGWGSEVSQSLKPSLITSPKHTQSVISGVIFWDITWRIKAKRRLKSQEFANGTAIDLTTYIIGDVEIKLLRDEVI